MPDQLRMYTIKPGEMEAWLEEWGHLIALLRRRLGFEIVGARTTEADRFPQVFDGSPFHFQFQTPTTEPSSITDFHGIVGGADLLGEGWCTETETAKTTHRFTAPDTR